ncbi:LSM_domain-containing protein [Hexamita inflata]|uniref:LSM domain-containing protein n=1 Tax=Hexamita inflata TaxID=28002 RepID=A0AA86PHP6_9EUKA|nr:LSM domain-containing protein [Hexamita inflata]
MPSNHDYLRNPQLQTYKNRECKIQLTNDLIVTGTISDYDTFMNVTVTNCTDSDGNTFQSAVIRGNSIVSIW